MYKDENPMMAAGCDMAAPQTLRKSFSQDGGPSPTPHHLLKCKIRDAREVAAANADSAADRLNMASDMEALLNELPRELSSKAEKALTWLLKKI